MLRGYIRCYFIIVLVADDDFAYASEPSVQAKDGIVSLHAFRTLACNDE